jgi:hypothetical protein
MWLSIAMRPIRDRGYQLRRRICATCKAALRSESAWSAGQGDEAPSLHRSAYDGRSVVFNNSANNLVTNFNVRTTFISIITRWLSQTLSKNQGTSTKMALDATDYIVWRGLGTTFAQSVQHLANALR